MTKSQTENTVKGRSMMGFWQTWSMSVGVMIGSGIFLLPTVLAPYGGIGILGWLVTSCGTILLALVLGRLSQRHPRSGGPYVYAWVAFGEFWGFLIAWGYWLGIILAMAAISVAFVSYLGALVPGLSNNVILQAITAVLCIWVLTGINLRGISEAASIQLLMTILKILPLLVIVLLAIFVGSMEAMPPFNPTGKPVFEGIAAATLLTMWAFIGIEAAVIPAAEVVNPKHTIPRAVVLAAITVAILYIAVSIAVMTLVPSQQLANSQAPLVDAAVSLGPWGGVFIAIGTLVSTAGSLNGHVLLAGQMPMAVAMDKLAPKIFAMRNKGNAPSFSLILSSVLATCLVVMNFADGLVDAFVFLVSLSTLAILMPYMISALCELKQTRKYASIWTIIAVLAVIYTVFAGIGSGGVTLIWGAILYLVAVPLFFLMKMNKKVADLVVE